MSGRVPVLSEISDEKKRIAAERSLGYMELKGGEEITDIKLDRVFIGSAPMRASRTCVKSRASLRARRSMRTSTP